MPKLPHLSGAEIIRALERLGFNRTRPKGRLPVLGWVEAFERLRGEGL